MRELEVELRIPEGRVHSNILTYDEYEDVKSIYNSYRLWVNLREELEYLGVKSSTFPQKLVEALVCVTKNVWCVKDEKGRIDYLFDCYDPNAEIGRNRIEIKSKSIQNELNTFGPRSKWDRLFLVDLYRDNKWDGTFDIYEIEANDINCYPINAKETFIEQILQKKRARLSIYTGLIKRNIYSRKETYRITEQNIERIY